MRKRSLRRTTLLSLLSLLGIRPTASAQATPPPQPSTADLLSFSASTEALLPTSSESTANRLPTSNFSFTVSLEQPTGNGTTVSTPIVDESRTRGSGATTGGSRTREGSARATDSNTEVVYMGRAVPIGYRKVGLAGALAGAAGVFLV